MAEENNRSELEKWAAANPDRRTIRCFWDWLSDRVAEGGHAYLLGKQPWQEVDVRDILVERALDAYFKIDKGKLEEQRQMLLDEQRALNQKQEKK